MPLDTYYYASETTPILKTPQVACNVVDARGRRVFYGEITYDNNITRIAEISPDPDPRAPYALPGLVDAHVHIESSLLTPQ